MYYNTCPHCGAHLDPDEHCDCLARVRGKKIRTKIGKCIFLLKISELFR